MGLSFSNIEPEAAYPFSWVQLADCPDMIESVFKSPGLLKGFKAINGITLRYIMNMNIPIKENALVKDLIEDQLKNGQSSESGRNSEHENDLMNQTRVGSAMTEKSGKTTRKTKDKNLNKNSRILSASDLCLMHSLNAVDTVMTSDGEGLSNSQGLTSNFVPNLDMANERERTMAFINRFHSELTIQMLFEKANVPLYRGNDQIDKIFEGIKLNLCESFVIPIVLEMPFNKSDKTEDIGIGEGVDDKSDARVEYLYYRWVVAKEFELVKPENHGTDNVKDSRKNKDPEEDLKVNLWLHFFFRVYACSEGSSQPQEITTTEPEEMAGFLGSKTYYRSVKFSITSNKISPSAHSEWLYGARKLM